MSGKRHWSERTANTIAEENRRLKRMYADVSMQNDLLKEALGKMIRSAQHRELAVKTVAMRGVSIALAYRAFDVREDCYRYGHKLDDENEQIAALLLGADEGKEDLGLRPVLSVHAQCPGTRLEPLAGLSDLPRAGVKPQD